MNLSVVKIIALDDCLHLLEASEEICEAFKAAIRKARAFAFMADSVGLNEQLDHNLLDHCRSNWNQTPDDESADRLKEKLALALGSIAYRALTRQAGLQANEKENLYRDAYLFRVYYAVKDASDLNAETICDIWKAMRQRNMIELHTFVPHMPNIDKWFEEMNEWDRNVETDRVAFAEAAADSETHDKHVRETNFYNPDDALLQLLLRLRRGGQVEEETFTATLQGEAKSVYAKTVLSGFTELCTANQFFSAATV